jgi:Mediator complex subunit 23
VVGGVDYKGVREIMKNCIEKAQTLPSQLHMSIRPQAEALSSVLSYIFNRKIFSLHTLPVPVLFSESFFLYFYNCTVFCKFITGTCTEVPVFLCDEMDRNAALLPGYFIVNEILKSYPVSIYFYVTTSKFLKRCQFL